MVEWEMILKAAILRVQGEVFYGRMMEVSW